MLNWRDRRHRRLRFFGRKPDSVKAKYIFLLSKMAFLGVVGMLVLIFVGIPIFALTLPSPEKVVRQEGFSTKILDRNGEVLYDVYKDQKRTPIEFDQMSDNVKKATVAIEDKHFYEHQGFDPIGMIRGILRLFTRGRAQGGSTLTQQLVKNVLLTSERSVTRKIKEFMLAIQIERKYSKDEILRMYLNEAPYGGALYGVEAASETYFGKKASDLTLVEAAILAGIPQRPTYYSPYSEKDAYKERTKQVLRRMREDEKISEDEEKTALAELENIKINDRGASFRAAHFVIYVQKLLEERYGEESVEQGGLKVTTTLDAKLQDEAQKVVAEEIAKVEKVHITNGASVVLNPETGEILAMVGSKDFSAEDYDGQVNVTLSLRQPGSSIKPFTYVTGLKKGYSASTLFMDVPTKFYGGEGQPDYEPVNYDGKFRGPIQLRYALANSINIPAVKMLALVGVKDVLQTAYEMGITTLEPKKETLARVGLSLTLGGGEVRLLDITDAYSGFLNGGFRVDPIAILKVEDNKGHVLEDVKPQKGKRVLTPEQAYVMVDILSDNEARKEVFGVNSLLNISGRQIAVKTGTTNDKRDNWTIGGNMNAVVGVWVGNNDNSPMQQVASGVSGASPIWRRILLEALKDKQSKSFDVPGGIITAAVDTISGYAAHDGYPSRIEKFVDGTQPGEDPVHVKLKVCKTDGKKATPGDVVSGNYEEKEFFVFSEKDPTAKPGENRWQDGINAWLGTQTDSRYKPPSDYCGSTNPVSVEFLNPKDQTSNLNNNVEIEVRADSTNNITSVELQIDGNKVATLVSRPFKHSVNLDDGVHTIKAIAKDDKNNLSDRTIKIGVNKAWDYVPVTQTPTSTPSPSPILTLSP